MVAACGGTDWEDPWRDARGDEVGEFVVTTYRGAEHCGWQSAVFLHLGWPLGTAAKTMNSARQYVRDPNGLFRSEVAPLDLDASLPDDAEDTGYDQGDIELWISKREAANAIYIVDGKRVERWPRTRRVVACA